MSDSTEISKPSKSGVESVERALSLLEAFNMGDNGLALKELARRTGLNKATILRLSASLEKFGYISRDHDGIFHLGSALWKVSLVYSCLLYTSPSPRDRSLSRMPSSA